MATENNQNPLTGAVDAIKGLDGGEIARSAAVIGGVVKTAEITGIDKVIPGGIGTVAAVTAVTPEVVDGLTKGKMPDLPALAAEVGMVATATNLAKDNGIDPALAAAGAEATYSAGSQLLGKKTQNRKNYSNAKPLHSDSNPFGAMGGGALAMGAAGLAGATGLADKGANMLNGVLPEGLTNITGKLSGEKLVNTGLEAAGTAALATTLGGEKPDALTVGASAALADLTGQMISNGGKLDRVNLGQVAQTGVIAGVASAGLDAVGVKGAGNAAAASAAASVGVEALNNIVPTGGKLNTQQAGEKTTAKKQPVGSIPGMGM